MNNSFDPSNFKVLVADDSRLVCNSIVVLLRDLGFDSNTIICAYRPTEVIKHCRDHSFDIIICDYNFNTKLNGYQLLAELKHLNLLSSHTFFAFLTGENQPKVVRTIIDSEPDDYLLKPFNKLFLSNRLHSGLRRKQTLAAIYEAQHTKDFERVLEECDVMLPFHSSYTRHITELKAKALLELERYDEAKQEYVSLLNENCCDYLKTKLANVMIIKGEKKAALNVLNTLENQDNNPYFHDEMASICISNGNLPATIEHLKQATLLMEAGAERELIISNLSLALGIYDEAYQYIKRYADKNEDTYRDSNYITLNYLRCFLYQFSEIGTTNTFENQVTNILEKISIISKQKKLSLQYTLLDAHIHMIRKDFRQAYLCMSEISIPENLHFYDYYHIAYILEKLGLFKDIIRVMNMAKKSIRNEQIYHIKFSQEHMLTSFEHEYRRKQEKILAIKSEITKLGNSKDQDGMVYLDLYIPLRKLMPNSTKVCLAIIKLIANNNLSFKDYRTIFNLISECNKVIVSQTSSEKRNEMKYKDIYTKARNSLSS
ncbi:response regulator [Vibrio cyclitrophicus]|nr:response regulator [Vibrio cyclitrophicus]UPR34882.1 response regulator [Vibrio cyclitrophicus]UPR48355.1 response regulator [Vibrio cyclitrophicus]